MKEKLVKFGKVILVVLFIPFLILIIIGVFLYTPIDFIRYRITKYYKDTKEKYTWMSTSSYYIRMYDSIMKADLPIEYIRRKEVRLNGYGYFFYKNFLILDYLMFYDKEINAWTAEVNEDEGYIRVEEAVNRDIQEFNEYMNAEIVNRAAILVRNDEIDKFSIQELENCEILLVAQDDITTALKNFITIHD